MHQFPKKLHRNRKDQMSGISSAERVRKWMCSIPLDTERNESRRAWIERVSGVLGISASLGSRYFYRQRKAVDGDLRDKMQERLARYFADLEALKAVADDNQARINELVYWRADAGRIVRAGQADPRGERSPADRERQAASGGSLRRQDRP